MDDGHRFVADLHWLEHRVQRRSRRGAALVRQRRRLRHAIGLTHEHNRVDGPVCPDGRVIDDGGVGHLMLGPPDYNSIMSYCAGAPTVLSPGDIQYIKKLFGPGEVTHGKNYALRLQIDRYVFPREDGSLKDYSGLLVPTTGKRNIFRVTRENGSGDVTYGDKIALNAATIDSPSGFVVNRYVCLSGTSFVSSTSPCYWTVQRTAGGGGGDKLNVNDPFRLRLGNVTFEHNGEKDLRMLGDFANTAVLEINPSFSPMTHDGVAVRNDDITVRKVCRFRGYVGGVLGGTWTGARPARVKAWQVSGDSTWLPGDWVDVANTEPVASRATCYR